MRDGKVQWLPPGAKVKPGSKFFRAFFFAEARYKYSISTGFCWAAVNSFAIFTQVKAF